MTQNEALEVLKSGKNVFLTGEPGSGKSYTINKFTDYLDTQGKAYAITASTGIAATHINGTTIHSWSGIGIKQHLDQGHINTICENRFAYERIVTAKVLIVDEVSMLHGQFINNLDYILCGVRHNKNQPFGGMQVVFVGDFFQLPPVSKALPGKPVIPPLFAYKSESWRGAELATCYLTEQHRQSDKEFLDILSAMRQGTLTKGQADRLLACQMNEKPATHLYTHNREVDNLNDLELGKLTTPATMYNAIVSGQPYYTEFLIKNCLSPLELELKIGALVMFTRNDKDGQYVNGSIGNVVDYSNDGPEVELLNGEVIRPDRAEWTIEEKGYKKASFKQFPLKLAWAITVHKSQGMSLDSATIDLSKTFEYGQGYVAISRVRTLAGLHLSGVNRRAFEVNPEVLEQDKIFREVGNA